MHAHYTHALGLLLQDGSRPDHSPSSWQVRVAVPTLTQPKLQPQVAVAPGPLPLKLTQPLSGLPRWMQNMSEKQGRNYFMYPLHKVSLKMDVKQIPRQTEIHDIHLQVGTAGNHRLSSRHVRNFTPMRTNPLLQIYCAVEPKVVPPETVTRPFAGLSGSPQSMAKE